MTTKPLAYFDGKKTHTGPICAHCKFFRAERVWRKGFSKKGVCSRKDPCYPNLCLCEMAPNTEPTKTCKHWKLRSDAEKIKCHDDLPSRIDVANDGTKFTD